MNEKSNARDRLMNPYLAGVCLGLVLLASFLILGAGLGASAGLARIGAFAELCVLRSHTLASEYFGKWGDTPLQYYLVYMFAGVFFGALVSVLLYSRFHVTVERGRRVSAASRTVLALAGGLLVGFASRLASGCTSGQALTGSAQLMTGSFVFLVCVFAGGYAAAFFVKGQWHD
jgi:uncharacterized membrane protein YedE/YeeE